MEYLTETTCSDSAYAELFQSEFQAIYEFCMCKTDNDADKSLTITNETFSALRDQWDTLPSSQRKVFLTETANNTCDDLSEQLRNKAIDAMIGFMSVN